MSGGGMSCSYGAGALTALIEKYNITNPDIIIARSGSAGTGSYFVSKQYNSIKNIWQKLLSNKKFINPLKVFQPMDINYLINEVFRKQDILNISNIYNSDIQFLVPVTNSTTGEVKYFNNKDNVD
jgi:predicted patatin/cPLA2 family phospholipase